MYLLQATCYHAVVIILFCSIEVYVGVEYFVFYTGFVYTLDMNDAFVMVSIYKRVKRKVHMYIPTYHFAYMYCEMCFCTARIKQR